MSKLIDEIAAKQLMTEVKTVTATKVDKIAGRSLMLDTEITRLSTMVYGSGTTALVSGGTGARGTASTVARSDHTHTLPAYPTLALLGLTATAAELNYIDGVTSSIQTQLNGKVNSNQVLTNVPVNAKFTDTVYTHPTNHAPSVITQDANNRFVTDAEKSTWNGKATTSVATTSANGLMSSADKVKMNGISTGANKVANSTTNGNILIDGTQTNVYTHPTGTNPHGTTKSDVGLGNVDNTSDTNKPISTATQSALNLKINTSQKGVANGIAQLNSNGVVPSSQLPSYVDDVLEYSSNALFPATGESGKIYINTTTNITYRWTGSGYAEISPSIALGETSSTAYAGDKGKITTDKVNGHLADTVSHITSTERTNWNSASTNNHTHSNKTTLDNTTASYTTAEKTKLGGIATGANNYTHPTTHAPSIITQNASNRFVTDTEKAAWNGKATQATIDASINSIEVGGVNLLIQKSITRGKYLNNTGNVVNEAGWFYSDDIPVSGIKNLTTSGYTNLGQSPSTCYYDINKVFIKGINNNGQSLAKLMTIDSNIKYVRFSGMIADLPTLKIEKGTTATSWSPAPEDVDSAIALKVDKVTGKSLLLDTEITRLRGMSAGANKVLNSATNGNILIDAVDTNVYTHPSGTNPHGTTKANVGLGSVDNTADSSKNVLSATKLNTARNIFGRPFNGTADISGKAIVHGTYQTNPNARYVNGALQIRECDLVTSTQSDIGYAPQIGFHWGGRAGATLAMDAGGDFQFINQAGTGYSNLKVNVLFGNVIGTATEASKLNTARTIALTGDVTGSVNFDGSTNATIAATVADDSHNHIINNVDGLATALAGKATPANITDSINSIQIGGSNLLPGSDFEEPTPDGFVVNANVAISLSTDFYYRGSKSFKIVYTGPNGAVRKEITGDYLNMCKGKEVSFSFKIRGNGSSIGKNIVATILKSDSTKTDSEFLTLTANWQTMYVTTTIPTNSTHFRLYIGFGSLVSGDAVYVDCAKLELGNKITDWTPAIEDMAYKITNGTTAARPTPTHIGQTHFDTTLGKPIWCKIVATKVWVDSTGTVV